jgi:hypothetical protein
MTDHHAKAESIAFCSAVQERAQGTLKLPAIPEGAFTLLECNLEQDGHRRTGRLAFVDGSPVYEGDLSAEEFQQVFIQGLGDMARLAAPPSSSIPAAIRAMKEDKQ